MSISVFTQSSHTEGLFGGFVPELRADLLCDDLHRLLSSGSLVVIAPTVEDTGVYECVVTNEAGQDNRTITLTVQGESTHIHYAQYAQMFLENEPFHSGMEFFFFYLLFFFFFITLCYSLVIFPFSYLFHFLCVLLQFLLQLRMRPQNWW